MSKKTLVIIPAFNERDNIVQLIDRIFELHPDIHVLVVDDSSPDGTADVVRAAQDHHGDKLQLLVREGKGGRGSAVLEGFRRALDSDYELIFEMDADFSHKPEEIHLFLEKINNCDCAIGSRYIIGSEIRDWGWKRTFFSKWANRYARMILGIPIKDYTNGFRCYTRRAIKALNVNHIEQKGYVVLSAVAYQLKKKGFTFGEVPTIFINRRRGISNLGLHEIREAFFGILVIRSPKFALHMRQGLMFIFCGATGAIIDLGSLAVFVELFEMDPKIAFIFSTLLAVVYVFLFNKYVTFKSHGESVSRQVVKFLSVYVFTAVINILIANALLWFGMFYLLAKAIAIGIIAFFNYLFSHGFIFRNR